MKLISITLSSLVLWNAAATDWTQFRGPGHWPDADMLPLGTLRMWTGGEKTKFTRDEQITMMTL